MLRKILSYFLVFILGFSCSFSTKSNPSNYPWFIKTNQNQIIDSTQHLKEFIIKLKELKSGKRKRLNIIHIGDSHIQCDWMSGQLRLLLQDYFGAAGRGLIFPYSVAKTNGPIDVYSSSNVNWESRRNIIPNPSHVPTGISGFGLRTEKEYFYLKLGISSSSGTFNKITLIAPFSAFYPSFNICNIDDPDLLKGLSNNKKVYHTVKKGESLIQIASNYGVSIYEIRKWNGFRGSKVSVGRRLIIYQKNTDENNFKSLPFNNVFTNQISINPWAASYSLNGSFSEVYLIPDSLSPFQESLLFGAVLEDTTKSGILYHMIGVNGATHKSYFESEFFFEQINTLKPDLIIVSLGTNESLGSQQTINEMGPFMESFYYSLKSECKGAGILITTPPDTYKKRKYKNLSTLQVRAQQIDFAVKNNLAYWDLFKVMGGLGSMGKWGSAGLASKDRVHFSQSGYKMQGQLLFDALMNYYNEFN